MFYRNTGITEKTGITLSKVIKTMSDISIVMTLSTLPTKRCGLYSLTTQRTLGTDASGHLCYWFYDGNNDRCLNGSTVLSGTDVKVGVVHSRKGVRLYVNGVLDAFCEAPLWSENVNTSYIGTHGLAPSDLEMDGTIEGVLLTDYAMTDEEMSVASWDSEFCVVKNHLFYVPSNSTLHVGDDIASSLDEGSVYVLEDTGSLVLSNEEKLPCWYIGEYNATTQDITLNISDKRGGGTYNRMDINHLVVHEIEVANTGHVVEAEGEEDVYPYLAVDEYNNAIFTNPHIDTMKVEYHCSATAVSEPTLITVWGSSYDDTFPYIYAKYTITYKDGASGTIISVVRDPTHQQYMVRTVTCYVESNSSTFTWPTDPTLFASGVTLSFHSRNARAGKYQFTRQWTWFGINWYASRHSDRPNASVITGFTSGHWVSGSETALFVVDDDYLRNIMVVEDVVSQSVKDYAISHSQPVSSYMGSKQLPSDLTSGYALKDSTGSLQAKDCYLNEIHADGFRTTLTTVSSEKGWYNIPISYASDLTDLAKVVAEGAVFKDLYNGEGEAKYKDDKIHMTKELFDKFEKFDDRPSLYSDGYHEIILKNWVSGHSDFGGVAYHKFLSKLAEYSSLSSTELNRLNKDGDKTKIYTRLCMTVTYNGTRYNLITQSDDWIEGELVVDSTTHNLGVLYRNVSAFDLNGATRDMMLALIISKENDNNIRVTVATKGAVGLFSSFSINKTDVDVHYYIEGFDASTKIFPFGVVSFYNIVGNPSYQVDYTLHVPNGSLYAEGATPLYIQANAGLDVKAIGPNQATYRYFYRFRDPSTHRLIETEVTNSGSPFPMEIQMWRNLRGEAYMRSLLPFDNTDSFVSRNGSTIGSADRMWDSVFATSLRDNKNILLRPFDYIDSLNKTTEYSMFLYDNYNIKWGQGVVFAAGVGMIMFENPYVDTDYIVLVSKGTVYGKLNNGFVMSFDNPDPLSEEKFDWFAIGKSF